MTRRESCKTCYWWDTDVDVDTGEEIKWTACRAAEPSTLADLTLTWPVSSADDWCPRYRRRNTEAKLSLPGVCPGCDAGRLLISSLLHSLRNISNAADHLRAGDPAIHVYQHQENLKRNLASALQHFLSEQQKLEPEPSEEP